jgi:sugar lactone lactonase YvrE
MYLIGLSGDDSGNLYLADHGNNRIRKVDSQGIITTVAGIGAAGFAGDGGLAPLAQLNSPVGLVVDRQHNIYISDYGNHRIRKIDNHGRISTLAGTGIPGNSPDGTEATQAQITLPWGIALDCRGQVLFTDLGAQSLKRLVAGKVFTVAKDFDRPTGLAVDCRGGQEVIYISDTNKNQIFTLINGLKRIIAGASPQDLGDSGPALNAELSAPYGLVLDPLGQLIIADTSHNRLRLIDRNGFITTLVAPNRHPN